MQKKNSRRAIALVLSGFVTITAAQAADNQELDQRLKVIERQLEISKEEADAKAKGRAQAAQQELTRLQITY